MAGKTVQMYDPSQGRAVSVPIDEVEGAETQGLTLETPETAAQREYADRAGLGQALLAGAEGAASGLTLGLSDVAAAELGGEDYRSERQLRDQQFSGAHMLGELAGTVAPALLSGGSTAAARAAAATPAGLLARAATAAERGAAGLIARTGVQGAERGVLRTALERAAGFGAAGALEGGVYGAGQALSEAAIADRLGGFDDAAERAWAGAKEGALLGFLGGAGLGGVAGVAESVGKKVASRFARSSDELAELANERALKVIDPTFAESRKLQSTAKRQQLGEDLRTYVMKDGERLLGAADNIEDIAPKLARAKAEVTGELAAIRRKVAEANVPVDAITYLSRVDDEVLMPLLNSPSPSIRRFGKRVQGELESFANKVGSGEPVTYADMLAQQDALKTIAYPQKGKGLGLPAPPKEWAEYLARSERILEDELEGHVVKVLGEVSPADVGRYAEAKRLSESFIKADKIAQKALGHKLGNRAISLTDYLTGIGAGAAVFDGGMSVAGGLAMAGAHKVARERGSAMLATLYNRTNAVDAKVNGTIAALFNQAKNANRVTARAPSTITKTIRKVQESGGQVRRATVGVAAGAAAAADAGPLSAREILKAAHNESDADAYDRVISRAQAVISGGPAGPMVIDDVAPNVGHAMRGVQQRAAQHLVSNAPVPPRKSTNPNLGAMTGDREPDPVSLYEFSRRVRAIDDPTTVLDDLKDGNLHLSAVEAVREVYPRMYQSMRSAVLEGLGNSSELLPYERRVMLGVVFDLPTDQTLDGAYIAQMQAVYQTQNPQVQAQQANAGAIAKSRRSGSENITLGDST